MVQHVCRHGQDHASRDHSVAPEEVVYQEAVNPSVSVLKRMHEDEAE
jgi:hypothetical protein